MKRSYPAISSPATIGRLQLKNRIILAAMGSNFAEPEGYCGQRLQAYYEARAKGGAGMLILETSAVSWPAGAAMPNTVGFSSDDFIPGLKQLAARVHRYDCKIAAQLNHSGKVAQEDTVAGRPLLVPSIPQKAMSDMMPLLTQAERANFIKAAGPDGKGPRYQVMSESDIQQLLQDFADAARRARQAGFDAVEIHAGHGYVLASFLSAAVNRRQDRYGGCLQNRARLMCETIQAVRRATGPDFPILVRMDAMEYRVEGGIRPEHFVEAAKLAQKAGADAIDVSAYGNIAKGIAFTEAPLVHKPGGFLEFARMARRVLDIPVVAVGRIELNMAERGLRNGDFDFIAMGRKLLADPELPNKVVAGRAADIRPCIYCYICVSQIFINQPLCCAVNPDVGREYPLLQTDRATAKHARQNALVIGGGPGGMEAARLLAEQGHQVSLWEQEACLGGTARIAALAYEPNGRLLKHLTASIQKLGVAVQLNTTASLENIRAAKPDVVVVATGAARKAPAIKGQHQRHVFDGEQLRGLLFGGDPTASRKLSALQRLLLASGRLLGLLRSVALMRTLSRLWMPVNKRVVIIGGGLVGLELAEFLQQRGREITVLEPGSTLGAELSIVRRSRVIHLLREHGVKLLSNAQIEEITATGVNYRLDGQTQQAAGGQVIIAMGASPQTSLSEQLQQAGFCVVTVGDCRKVAYIDGAMLDARKVLQIQDQ